MMTTTLILIGIAIVILLLVSGFLSGAETALTAVSRGRMHQLERDGSRRARDVNQLAADKENLIGTILLGNTFINIFVSSLATWVATELFASNGVAIATGVMTVLILVFTEVMPKTLAIARTDRYALAVAGILRPIVQVLGPVVRAVQWFVWTILMLFGVRQHGSASLVPAHEEIRGTVALHHIEGAMPREHRDMIGGVLDLRDLRVGHVMIHRKNVAMLDGDAPRAELFEALLAANHTRLPVWRGTSDNIVGMLNTKDVMREFVRRRGQLGDFDLLSLMHEARFVPDTTGVEDLLRAFREQRSHFAIVVDEYGTIQGIVTLEDIINEIVGEMPEEKDASTLPGIRPQPDGSFNIDGVMPVRDINRALEWDLPDQEATTLAGLVIHEARTIPDVGQRFAFYGFQFEILRRQRNQITAIRVTPPRGG